MAITPTDIRLILETNNWRQLDLTRRLGLAEGTVSHWLSGRRHPTGIYLRELEKLYAQALLQRAGVATPRANREELHGMIERIVSATTPETPADATPEQRAYDTGRRETSQLVLEAVIDALWQQTFDGRRYDAPPPDKELTR